MFGKQFKNVAKKFLLSNKAAFHEICRLSVVQCNSYGSLNIRRFLQILQLYKNLYNEKSVYGLFQNFSRRWPIFYKPVKILSNLVGTKTASSALLSASIFSFTAHGIADEEMIEAANGLSEVAAETSIVKSFGKKSMICCDELKNWELVTEQTDFNVWRRPLSENSSLYEYKCAGRFYDVPAYGFYFAQVDLDYRKQWDKLVLYLDMVDSDSETGSEVIRWVTNFPFPMCPREYVYVRRSCISTNNSSIILTSKTVCHPKCPRDEKKFVRVDDYYSCMVIKPHHADYMQNGFDFVLTYFDDPKATFPSFAYNWMVTAGVPNFIQKAYLAAKLTAKSGEQIEKAAEKLQSLTTQAKSEVVLRNQQLTLV